MEVGWGDSGTGPWTSVVGVLSQDDCFVDIRPPKGHSVAEDSPLDETCDG